MTKSFILPHQNRKKMIWKTHYVCSIMSTWSDYFCWLELI